MKKLNSVMIRLFVLVVLVLVSGAAITQSIRWTSDGGGYYRVESGEIVQYLLPANTKNVLVTKKN